jgi:ATP-dependent protease ClpP protease subunit
MVQDILINTENKEETMNNSDILRLLSRDDSEPFEVTAAPINQFYRAKIDKEFREVEQFAYLVDVLDNAQEGDIVHIKLSTVGGALHAIIPLISSMKNTAAYIHMHVESDTASAGTLLMMLAHSLYVNEYATIMFHNVQYGAYGHGGNVEAQVKHSTATNKKIIRDMYTDYLTEEEIKRLEDGLELYLTPEECMERFQLREELRGNDGCECGECNIPDDDTLAAIQKMADSIEQEEDVFQGLEEAYNEPRPPVADKKPRKKK